MYLTFIPGTGIFINANYSFANQYRYRYVKLCPKTVASVAGSACCGLAPGNKKVQKMKSQFLQLICGASSILFGAVSWAKQLCFSAYFLKLLY
jgi:hypothetical protein